MYIYVRRLCITKRCLFDEVYYNYYNYKHMVGLSVVLLSGQVSQPSTVQFNIIYERITELNLLIK